MKDIKFPLYATVCFKRDIILFDTITILHQFYRTSYIRKKSLFPLIKLKVLQYDSDMAQAH